MLAASLGPCLMAATPIPPGLSCHILCLLDPPAVSSRVPSATAEQSELTALNMFSVGADGLAWDQLKLVVWPQEESAASF